MPPLKASGVEAGLNLLQDGFMATLLSNLTQTRCECCRCGLSPRSKWTAAEERRSDAEGEKEGQYVVFIPIYNMCNIDDRGNMFCHSATVENKCINSCFVYRGCQLNCYSHGPRVSGMGTFKAAAVGHVVSIKLTYLLQRDGMNYSMLILV